MVYLRLKENTSQAKAFLEFLKTLPFIEIVDKKDVPNLETMKAIAESKKRKITNATDVKDLMKKLNN